MPVLETRLRLVDGRIAGQGLEQRPVRDLPGDTGGTWPMKLRVRLGDHDRDDVVLDARFEGAVAAVASAVGLPAPDTVWANDADEGYGVLLPDARTLAWALTHVGSVANPLLRAPLWIAVWDAVREAIVPPADYVAVALRELPGKADEQISRAMVARAAALRAGWQAALISADRCVDRRVHRWAGESRGAGDDGPLPCRAAGAADRRAPQDSAGARRTGGHSADQERKQGRNLGMIFALKLVSFCLNRHSREGGGPSPACCGDGPPPLRE